MTDDDICDWDAAYVLGALSREDRCIYEAFLAVNPERTAAMDELAGLLGRLNVLSRDEALALIWPVVKRDCEPLAVTKVRWQ